MEQNETSVSEVTVVRHNHRYISSKFLQPYNWYVTDPTFLAEKYKMNSIRKFEPVDKSKIRFRKQKNTEEC